MCVPWDLSVTWSSPVLQCTSQKSPEYDVTCEMPLLAVRTANRCEAECCIQCIDFFFNEPYSSQQQWCGCLISANNFIRETELQIRGDKKIANFHLKSVPYLLAYRGRKIKIHYIKSKSYRLLFLEHFELETFAAEQFASFLPLCTLPSIQQYLW